MRSALGLLQQPRLLDRIGEDAADGADVPTRDFAQRAVNEDTSVSLDSLSHRERQVFKMLAMGFANRDIGTRLALSPKTVATYRARLTDKLGVRSRASLVDVALRMGVLAPEG